MISRGHFFRKALLLSFAICGSAATGHDLTTSYATFRYTPNALELQIKIAADAAWPAVQATVAPGAVFVLEEFETTGKAHLLAFARTMEELAVEGVPLSPRDLKVEVVEDNFLFTFTYPRPAGRAMQLTEKYLKLMASDYASRIVVLDQNEKTLASKTLHFPSVSLTLPAHPPVANPTAPSPKP